MASNIPVIVQGNSFSLAIPLQIYYINGDQMDLEDYTPDPTDEVSIQLKGSRRNYTYTPTIDGNVANIDLTGNELADNYGVVVSVVKANGQRLRSFRTDQFFIVESSDDLTMDDIIEGLEENVIYLNAQPFIAGADGRGIESIVKTGTSGLVDTYTITYTDATTSTFNVTNGANGEQGEAGATIESVEKTATVGKVDTYTITMTDGNTFDFEVTNGLDGVDLGLANIVDDLTTGGATNVLSAEQGKLLNERLVPVESTLEISSSSAEVSERIGYVQNIGYINANSITQQASGQLRYSDPIFLKAGELLKIKGITTSNVGRIATCDAQGGSVVRLEMGQSPNNPTSAADAYETTYTASDDVYVIVGWYWNFYQLELTKTYNKTTTTSKIDDVDAIADALDFETATETKTEDLVYTEKVGGYGGAAVGKQSSYASGYTLCRCTEDFLLKKGDTLQITAKNVATNISLLVTLDGTKYRTVIMGNNSEQSETYTAPVDGYYAVTWLAAQGVTLKVTTTRTTTESERIANIEESTTQIPSIAAKANAANDAIFVNIVDNFTSDVNEGQCISDQGLIANTGYGFKEFSVRAGAVVSFSSVTHSQIAPIAKKIAEGKYEPLFVATGFVYETFTYTATENCVLALSCYGTSTAPVATINNQLVASNSLNIDKLIDAQQKSLIPDYGMFFDKVAVIGDSLTVGTLDGLTGGHPSGGSYNCSWLTYLAKKWGSTIRMHYGRGGTTCYDWIGNNDYGLGLMLKDSVVYDVYFVAYGHNDVGGFAVGTTSDTPTAVTVDAENNVTVDTPAANTTFLGNYKKIVNEIRTKAPNALIFLVSTDGKDTTATTKPGYMNQYIEELAEWYYAQGDHRVFYIDYANKLKIAGETAGYHTGGHFSTFGYAYVANIINGCVNEAIYAHLSTVEIKEWGKFIGAGYRTTEIDLTTSGGYLPHL